MPPNYDNIDSMALECRDTFPRLENGHPDPVFTGYPNITNCSKLEYAFSDLEFDVCGAGLKVLREWTVIDWCTAESIDHNQILKIEDRTPPVISCPEDITVYTKYYECLSTSFLIEDNLDIDDCSETELTWTIKDEMVQYYPFYPSLKD